MLHPVVIIQICVSAGRTTVDHMMIANINADMRDSANLISHGALEEYQVPGLDLILRYCSAEITQTSRTKPAGVVNA